MTLNSKQYDRDFKTKAVLLSFEQNSIARVAEELNISKQSLYLWRKDFIKYGEGSFPGYGNLRMGVEQRKVHELQKEIEMINREIEIITKAGDYLNEEKFHVFNFISKNEKKYPVKLMCKILGENRGTYRIWKKQIESDAQKRIMALKKDINLVFFTSQQRYGCRRIAAELQKYGYNLSHTTVLKHMRELGLSVSVKKQP